MKQYILKPGRHQFAPGSPAIHHNNNLSDEEAKWYLEKYPHIKSLFEVLPDDITKAQEAAIPNKRKRRTARKVNIETFPEIEETRDNITHY